MNAGINNNTLPIDSDEELDALFPLKIRKLSSRHWTPVSIAKRIAAFFAQHGNSRILDIGSGVGKFCLVAASVSSAHFIGVEQRESLVRLSRKIALKHRVERVEFLHSNILSINFRDYDGFYFFNSFEENRSLTDRIDDEVDLNRYLYHHYSRYLCGQLEGLPQGTKIVTYCSGSEIIPDNYVLLRTEIKGKLKFWEKRY